VPPALTKEMDGLARREGVGDGEQRSEHEQPDDYGPPLRRWQGTVWEAPPGAVVVLIAPVVDLQRTAPRAFFAPEFGYVCVGSLSGCDSNSRTDDGHKGFKIEGLR